MEMAGGAHTLSLSPPLCLFSLIPSIVLLSTIQMTAMESARTKIEELRRLCDREIAANQQKFDSAVASFGKSLQSLRSNAEQSAHNQGFVPCFFAS